MRPVAATVAVLYAIALLALTFLPFGAQGTPGVIEVHLQPFQTIRGALRLGPDSYEYGVLIGNLLAFVPLGLLAPVLTRSRSVVLAVAIGFAVSVAIELGQLGVSLALGYTYRSADVDDVIVNTLGTMLGYSIFFLVDSVAEWLGQADSR